jgi:hypothetical protein
MDAALFDDLERALAADGPEEAIGRLCDRLRERKDYNALFYALLLRKRHELGVSPVPTGPSTELPAELHPAYEDAIRQAARLVGGLYLEAGNLSQAWAYYRMLGEPALMRAALDQHQPAEDEDIQPLVHIALYEGAHPEKGFGWVLDRYGLCNAITTLSSQELPLSPEERRRCVGRLVRSLHEELRERLATEVARREGRPPAEAGAPGSVGSVQRLMVGRDWLFEEEFAHVDVSHLSSVVQMAAQLGPGPELGMARELCDYGQRLSGRSVQPGEPPFERLYEAYGKYLAVLAGDDVEANLDHFRRQAADADPETVGTYPAEVLVNLLLKLERTGEALAVARKYHLAGVDGRQLTCPGVAELCQKAGDYRALADVAREQGDAVHFLAGLLAARAGAGSQPAAR